MSFLHRLKTKVIQPKLQELALWRINRDIMQKDYPRLAQMLEKYKDRLSSSAFYLAEPLLIAANALAQSDNLDFKAQAATCLSDIATATTYENTDLSNRATDGWNDCLNSLFERNTSRALEVAAKGYNSTHSKELSIPRSAAHFIVAHPDAMLQVGLETAIYYNQEVGDALHNIPELNKMRTGNLLTFAKQLEPLDPIEADYIAQRVACSKFTCAEHKQQAITFMLNPTTLSTLEQKTHKLGTARWLATSNDIQTINESLSLWTSLIDQIAQEDLDAAITLTADNHHNEAAYGPLSAAALSRFATFIDRKAETDLEGAILSAVDATTDGKYKKHLRFRECGADKFTEHMTTLMRKDRTEALNLAVSIIKRGVIYDRVEQTAARVIKSIEPNYPGVKVRAENWVPFTI